MHPDAAVSVVQVCDSEWHHLSLSVQFPSVTLYVDGVTFDPALIHDNGALPNPAPRQRMSIGACWGKLASARFTVCFQLAANGCRRGGSGSRSDSPFSAWASASGTVSRLACVSECRQFTPWVRQ